MTGADTKRRRLDLGLNPSLFAQLLGVSPSTVYRWEALGRRPLQIEPMQRRLIAAIESVPTAQRKPLGQVIEQSLLMRGPLAGLYTLLACVFAERPKTWPIHGREYHEAGRSGR